MNDVYNLKRFLDAQQHTFDTAYNEIKNGKKVSHWMWFVFPQIVGLGYSEISKRYAISNLQEAAQYLEHQVLGNRLIRITTLLLNIKEKTAYEIFGSPDDLKLRSSMTLFSSVSGADSIFNEILDMYFGGEADNRTLQLLMEM